jgi:hypothetical protein
MENDIVLTLADGSVRIFRIYGRAAPRVGEVVTLPIDGKLIKVRADRISGTEIVASVDHVNAVETVG